MTCRDNSRDLKQKVKSYKAFLDSCQVSDKSYFAIHLHAHTLRDLCSAEIKKNKCQPTCKCCMKSTYSKDYLRHLLLLQVYFFLVALQYSWNHMGLKLNRSVQAVYAQFPLWFPLLWPLCLQHLKNFTLGNLGLST